MISLDSIAKISRLKLASVAAQAGLCLAWSETPEDTFCHVVARLYFSTCTDGKLDCVEKYENCTDDHVCNHNQVYLFNACRRTCKGLYGQECDNKKHVSACQCPEGLYEKDSVCNTRVVLEIRGQVHILGVKVL